jgi:peptidoglycan/LPS O-acetylase OafA/YrhL
MRLWLAVAVVAGHGAPVLGLPFFDPSAAVLGFYVISGFYMAMVLEGSYEGRLGSFYFNRFLRIYPAYWVVLLLTVIPEAWNYLARAEAYGPFISLEKGVHPGLGAWLLSCLSQVLIFGQEWAAYFSIDSLGKLQFQSDSYFLKNSFWHFNFIPQAWTLSVELSFYLLAPWAVKLPSRILAFLFGAGLLLRAELHWAGMTALHPWLGRFFPLELSVFFGGILAWRLASSTASSSKPGPLASRLLLLALALLPFLGVSGPAQEFALPLGVAALLPLWGRERGGPLQRLAGDLSYPLYLCHFSVFEAFDMAYGKATWSPWLLPCSLLAALAVHFGLERPMRRWRRPTNQGL